jgi:hypothetical protein
MPSNSKLLCNAGATASTLVAVTEISGYKGLYVDVLIGDSQGNNLQKHRFLVDSGSAICLIKNTCTPPSININQGQLITARGITGHVLQLSSEILMTVVLPGLYDVFPFVICNEHINLPVSGILGLSFLKSINAVVDLQNDLLIINQRHTKLLALASALHDAKLDSIHSVINARIACSESSINMPIKIVHKDNNTSPQLISIHTESLNFGESELFKFPVIGDSEISAHDKVNSWLFKDKTNYVKFKVPEIVISQSLTYSSTHEDEGIHECVVLSSSKKSESHTAKVNNESLISDKHLHTEQSDSDFFEDEFISENDAFLLVNYEKYKHILTFDDPQLTDYFSVNADSLGSDFTHDGSEFLDLNSMYMYNKDRLREVFKSTSNDNIGFLRELFKGTSNDNIGFLRELFKGTSNDNIGFLRELFKSTSNDNIGFLRELFKSTSNDNIGFLRELFKSTFNDDIGVIREMINNALNEHNIDVPCDNFNIKIYNLNDQIYKSVFINSDILNGIPQQRC